MAPPFLVATVDTLPQPYEVVGLVEASVTVSAGSVHTDKLWDKLQAGAESLGGDAVIGIRLSHVTLPGASKQRWFGYVEHYLNTVLVVATGTAVRRLPVADGGRAHQHPVRRPVHRQTS